VDLRDLYEWCGILVDDLIDHPRRRVPLRLSATGADMAGLMARELVDEIRHASALGRKFRVIIPCGPRGWYEPFVRLVNGENVSLRHVEVFHMDECLDWQGRVLPRSHPFSFRGVMQTHFYHPVRLDLAVLEENRHWLEPETMTRVEQLIAQEPIDLVYGGWGQDGHVAYNQARRNPYSELSIDDVRQSTIRIQENNLDTVIALAQRDLGAAYQFAPPMSVTLGMRQILSAKKIRLFSDTGAWKQTALRVALFSAPDPRYPVTLLQEHPDALLTATRETADHPISRHPDWALVPDGVLAPDDMGD
jgi:glucosamine-6-phosphate deaminase